ncbi:MAG: HDOD domain-containing protein [Halomonas sp.]|nr:HDOD domain-containing protein [Halomonas sp.]MBP5979840.1 HDOD domain-containing protein [Halomonas sp.]
MTGSLASDDTLYMTLTRALPAFLSHSLLQCKNLPALPSVALKVLEIARSSRSTLNDYANAIEHDPALTLRLIALANSAYYSRPSLPVQTCLEAMQRLGLDTTLTVILGFSLFQHAQGESARKRTWQRVIIAALVARYLAEQLCPKQSGSVFTTALLQDIGILAFQSTYPEEAKSLYADPHPSCTQPPHVNDSHSGLSFTGLGHTKTSNTECSHTQLARAEQRYFGCDHTLVGAWLAAKWGVPDNIVNAIHQSHESFLVSDKEVLCIRLSGPITDAWLSANPAPMLAALLHQLKAFGRTRTLELKDVLEHVQQQTDVLASALKMTAPIEVGSDILLAEAQQILFEHTLTLGVQLDEQQQALTSLRYPDAVHKEDSRLDASINVSRARLMRTSKKSVV